MDLGYTTEYHNRRGYDRGRVKGTTAIITGNYVPLVTAPTLYQKRILYMSYFNQTIRVNETMKEKRR